MNKFKHYRSHIQSFELNIANKGLPDAFKIEDLSSGPIETYYSCFEYINPTARIVLCGITPGMQQATNAILAAKNAIETGLSDLDVVKAAKEFASFSGSMRNNLIDMLDFVGINKVIDIQSCKSLFGEDKHLVHYTSALRYPVFVNGANYSGTPNMLKTPCLRYQIETFLAQEVRELGNDCIYVPLGPKVTEALQYLQSRGLLLSEQIIAGLPHPSGANAERINYFMGKKAREQLSEKTNATVLDNAREEILAKVEALRIKAGNR